MVASLRFYCDIYWENLERFHASTRRSAIMTEDFRGLLKSLQTNGEIVAYQKLGQDGLLPHPSQFTFILSFDATLSELLKQSR
jgi:hypothetical protein